jgi:hypothetical protein
MIVTHILNGFPFAIFVILENKNNFNAKVNENKILTWESEQLVVIPNTQTNTGSIVRPCYIRALQKSPVLNARAITCLIEALLIYIGPPTMQNRRSTFYSQPELGTDKVYRGNYD